jgi:hypothetical protein
MLSDPIKLEVDPINLMVSGVFTLFNENSSTPTWFNFMWARIFGEVSEGDDLYPEAAGGLAKLNC